MTSDGSVDALVDALVQSAFEVMGVLTRIGAENDLSLTQLRVFGILRDRRPRMTELAVYLGLDKSTMSGLIDRAERRGLLARGRNPDDRRIVDVFLTPAGRELTERLYDEVRHSLAPATGRLAQAQRDQLVQLLEPVLMRPSGPAREASGIGEAGGTGKTGKPGTAAETGTAEEAGTAGEAGGSSR